MASNARANAPQRPIPNTPAKRGDADDNSEYLIRSRTEVTALLEAVRRDRRPVAISLADEEEFLLSTVLALDEEADRMTLAYGDDKQKNRTVLQTRRLACEVVDRHARLHFVVVRPEQAVINGAAAFRVALPEWVCRLHRRRDARVKVSPFAPLIAVLNFGVLGKMEVEVTDISMSGIGMLKCPADIVMQPNEVLTGCAILLPGTGPIPVALRVAYCKPATRADGSQRMQRVGCAFVAPATKLRDLIRHYIIQLAPDEAR